MRKLNPDLTIHAGDYVLDEVSDLAQLGQSRFDSFEIMTNGFPTLELRIDRRKATLSAVDPTLGTLGAMDQIQRQIPRRFTLGLRGFAFAALYALAVAVVLVILTVESASPFHSKSIPVSWVVVEIAIILPIFPILFFGSREATVNTLTRAEAPPFWQRTRDDWIVNLVFLVAGALVGFLVGKI